MTTNAFKKVQYGYHGKNGVFSDHTERTYSETYSNRKIKKIVLIYICGNLIGSKLGFSTVNTGERMWEELEPKFYHSIL